MANILLDFSRKHVYGENVSMTHKFVDIGTNNIKFEKNENDDLYIKDTNTTIYDKEAIKTSLKNIFSFRHGESILSPTFGASDLYEQLYQPLEKYGAEKIVKIIKGIIADWEPRINVTSTPMRYFDDTHEIFITINYDIPDLQTSDSYELNFSR